MAIKSWLRLLRSLIDLLKILWILLMRFYNPLTISSKKRRLLTCRLLRREINIFLLLFSNFDNLIDIQFSFLLFIRNLIWLIILEQRILFLLINDLCFQFLLVWTLLHLIYRVVLRFFRHDIMGKLYIRTRLVLSL